MGHAEIDQLDLAALVDRLEELDEKRTPVGWTPDDAVIKSAVERRILELIGADATADERRAAIRIPCHLDVVVRAKDRSARGEVINIGTGGAYVVADSDLPVGSHVYVEVRGTSDEHGLRARGQVAWLSSEPAGLGVCFSEQPSSADERRLRRFVMEILRNRVPA